MSGDARYWLRENMGTLFAFVAFVAMFALYVVNHSAGLNANVAQTAAGGGTYACVAADASPTSNRSYGTIEARSARYAWTSVRAHVGTGIAGAKPASCVSRSALE